jgi:hypothetical protein
MMQTAISHLSLRRISLSLGLIRLRRIRLKRSAVSFGWALRFIAAVFLFSSVACGPPSDERQVKNAVGAFYDVYMTVHPSGVPTQEEQAEFNKVISAGLADLLNVAAGVEEDSFQATTLEGDVFTSLDEGAASYKILECEIQAPAACVVELSSAGNRKRPKLAWKDRVFVVREGERWVVDDIEFLGDGPLMHKGRLKDVLKQIIDEGKSSPAV